MIQQSHSWSSCVCTQLHLTLCDPMAYRSPGSSVHGISQARLLEWVDLSFSRGSSWPRDQTCFSSTGRYVTTEPPGTPFGFLIDGFAFWLRNDLMWPLQLLHKVRSTRISFFLPSSLRHLQPLSLSLSPRTSLVVQWLRPLASTSGHGVGFLVRELGSLMLPGEVQQKHRKTKNWGHIGSGWQGGRTGMGPRSNDLHRLFVLVHCPPCPW